MLKVSKSVRIGIGKNRFKVNRSNPRGFVCVPSGVTLESENVIFPLLGRFKVNVNIRSFPVIEWLRMVAGLFNFPLHLAVDFLSSITPLQTTSSKVQLIFLLPAFTSPFKL